MFFVNDISSLNFQKFRKKCYVKLQQTAWLLDKYRVSFRLTLMCNLQSQDTGYMLTFPTLQTVKKQPLKADSGKAMGITPISSA